MHPVSSLFPLLYIGNSKDEFHPVTDDEGPELEWRYSSNLSLNSALGGVGGQRHAPAALPALPPGNSPPLAMYTRLKSDTKCNL